jgi:LPS export ABC transporter protein LptC
MLTFWNSRSDVQKLALVLGGGFVLYLLASAALRDSPSGKRAAPVPGGEMIVSGSELVLQDFSRLMLRRGKKSMEVKAETGRFLPQENITYLTGATVTVQRDKGKPVVIRARNARLFMEGEQVKRADLEGSVEVEFGEGMTLKTELASFESDTQLIKAPGAAQVEGEGYEITGDGLEAEIDQEVVRLLRDVVSRFRKGARLPKGSKL